MSDAIKIQKKLRSIYAKHKDSLTEDEKTAIILAGQIIYSYDKIVALCEPITWEDKDDNKEMEDYKKLKITPSEVVRCGTYCKCDGYEGPFCECTYEGECYYRDCMMKVLEAAKEKEDK